MDANKDEAERSKALGRTALQNGDYTRAIRLLRLSDRLHSDPDTRQLLNSALAAEARANGPPPQSTSQSPAAGGAGAWSQNDLFGRVMTQVDLFIDQASLHLPLPLKGLIDRSIHPSMRRPLAYVALMIVVMVIYRFFLRGPRLSFGGMPGDIHYQSRSQNSSVYINFPIISCLLFSGAAHLLQRLWRRY